jgi:hypothetical protein
MAWLTIINEVFDILWLITIVALLWAIWRSSEHRLHLVKAMEGTLIDVATKDAESARQSVETTRILADVLQNEQARNGPKQ